MQKIGLFSGTFNPPSNGHLSVIERASKIVDTLYVYICESSHKKLLFSLDKRAAMVKKITAHLPNVKVVYSCGLIYDFAKKNNVHYLIRGLRTTVDYNFEMSIALANRKVSNLETIFLLTDEENFYVSSSLIRQIGSFNLSINSYVPKSIQSEVLIGLKAIRLK